MPEGVSKPRTVSQIGTRVNLCPVMLASWFVMQSCPPHIAPALADQSQVDSLNNDGAKALNSSNFQLAIQKFEEALKLDPNYKLASDNLATAYSNYGLQLRGNSHEALKQFHKALYLNRSNATTWQNIEGVIRLMGKNPKSFQDRVDLGDQARLAGDSIGAIIEYSAALQLKDDPKLHVKLSDAYRVHGEEDKAAQEDLLASNTGAGAQSRNPASVPESVNAASNKSSDQDALDAVVSRWNAAVVRGPLDPKNHIALGEAYQNRGDFGQAETEYKMARKCSPDHRNPVAERLLAALPAEKQQAAATKHSASNSPGLRPGDQLRHQNISPEQERFEAEKHLRQRLLIIASISSMKQSVEKGLAS